MNAGVIKDIFDQLESQMSDSEESLQRRFDEMAALILEQE